MAGPPPSTSASSLDLTQGHEDDNFRLKVFEDLQDLHNFGFDNAEKQQIIDFMTESLKKEPTFINEVQEHQVVQSSLETRIVQSQETHTQSYNDDDNVMQDSDLVTAPSSFLSHEVKTEDEECDYYEDQALTDTLPPPPLDYGLCEKVANQLTSSKRR